MPIKMMPTAISPVNQNRTELGLKRSFADITIPAQMTDLPHVLKITMLTSEYADSIEPD
jgi:hypothetical protein